ncbi:hypothetical protein B0H17DRAFT_1124982 [Mycena rosella]|uniref:Uncharacterized protein n=1 Tax=Mycena rosella TaxID=1033263 RepID=A0AAD7GZ13_MYCRO|nr:hypothetical protein B0H17DRAFT_1124982 [Mycena rosella]
MHQSESVPSVRAPLRTRASVLPPPSFARTCLASALVATRAGECTIPRKFYAHGVRQQSCTHLPALPPAPPEFDLTHLPQSTDSFTALSDPSLRGNFARSAKFGPNGAPKAQLHWFNASTESSASFLRSQLVRTLPQPAPILEYAWYPGADPANPATFCFIASTMNQDLKNVLAWGTAYDWQVYERPGRSGRLPSINVTDVQSKLPRNSLWQLRKLALLL